MEHIQIEDKISQITLTDLESFDNDVLTSFEKKDKENGVSICVMYDNLSSQDQPRYNYHNYVSGLEFFHEQYGFEIYPPDTYLSQDMRFMKSTISHYRDSFYNQYTKIKKMNLEQYLVHLETIYTNTDPDQKTKKQMMEQYLVDYVNTFTSREKYPLFCIASDNQFLAKGMYLFGILPTMFVKLL